MWVIVVKLMEEGVSEVVIDSLGNVVLSFVFYLFFVRIWVYIFVFYDVMFVKIFLF